MTTNPSSDRSTQITASKIRFISELPTGSAVYRQFADPRPTFAVREPTTVDLSTPASWPAPCDLLEIVCVSDPKGSGQKMQSWLARPEKPDAVASIAVESETVKLRWLPGRAVIAGLPEDCDAAIAGLVEFAFFEGELRRLEHAILKHQAAADADVALAYDIRHRDRSHWDRLYRTMEELYRLRLQFARLEPHLYESCRSLPAGPRRIVARLSSRAEIEGRLEALNDRLETIEALYEGAIDRITDYRNYRKGALLEIGIVILLGIEVVLLLLRH